MPAIRADCASDGIEVIATGASLGAFMAVAVTCRYPWLFRAAVGMSGSYDLERLFGFGGTDDYYFCHAAELHAEPRPRRAARRGAPPVRHPRLWPGPLGEPRRIRGGWPGCSAASGVPNRVDPWGPEYDHDWPTWRQMLPGYLDELAP